MDDDQEGAPDEQAPARRTDQQIFDDQVARGSGKAVLLLGALGIFAALLMSAIALVNSGGGSSTTTVSVPIAPPAGQSPTGGQTRPLTGDALGKELFVSGDPSVGATSCGSCHIMKAAGATGTTGPNLDKVLTADPASATRESIVDPNKEIVKGYRANVMPSNYGTTLSHKQLDALVTYVYRNTNTKAKAK